MVNKLSYYKEYRKKHPDYWKEYRKKHPQKMNPDYMKEYLREHPQKKKDSDNKYARTKRKEKRRERRKIDPKFRLDSNMSSIISTALKGKKAGRKWVELVGYTIEDLINHLEKQFDRNMSWNNYGSYWWLDHIKPRSSFNYKSGEDKEFRECWSLENLQPLEKIENIKKGCKLDYKFAERSVVN